MRSLSQPTSACTVQSSSRPPTRCWRWFQNARPRNVFFGHDVAAVEAEVVEAVVVDEPGVGAAGGGAGEREERVAGVFDAGAEAEAALAQVVEVEVPLDACRRFDAEQLERVELEQRLEAEDRVVADADVVDVVARLFQVGRERRPVEDGHAADVQEVVLAFDHAAGGRRPAGR